MVYTDEIVEYPSHSEAARELVDAMRQLQVHSVGIERLPEVF